MGLNAFIARDVIQYILPSIIAFGLFIPIYDNNISAEYIILGGALIGYFISSFVSWIAGWSILQLPYVRRKYRDIDAEYEWWTRNFDFTKLWQSLSKDEKEYLYGTQSYYELYKAMSLYLLLYALVNIYIIVNGIVKCHILTKDYWNCAWTAIAAERTTLFWKGSGPAWLLALLSIVLFLFSVRDMLIEYRLVFGAKGQYVTLARLL